VAWIGTTRGGINKCLAGAARFAHFKHDRQDPGSLGRNDVRSLDAAGPGRVWVGFDEGLDEFDERTGRLRSFRHDPGDGNGLGPGAVQAIHEDSRGRFWVGLAEGGLGLLDRDGGTVRHYRYDPANPESLSGNAVTAIASDRIDPDILWIGTLRGLNRLDVRTGKFRRYLPRGPDPAGLSGRAVLCLLEDSAETLWVGTRTGLNRVAKATGACETYVRDIRHPAGNGPFDNVIRCLYLDTRGILWIGTENGLNRFDRTRGEWRYYLPRDGLPGEVVCGILADGAGALWIGTNRGLARFDPGTETFTAFGTADGLQGDAFNGGACVKGADGRMRFGGINGYNVFRPEDLKPDPSVPPLAWTGFSRNNRKISAGGGLGAGREIRLTGRDRFVSFDFAALSYVDPPSNAFAYKLEPRDREWIDLGHERSVVLSGLRPGRHVLRVKGAGRNGVWNEDGLSLALSVASPFWRSGWFIGLAAWLLASGAGAVLLMWTKLRTAYLQATPNVDAFIAGSGLTAREAEILRLILRGAGNKDIAAALFISTSTVRNHVYNMYRKLGVKSRIELVNRINAKAKRPTS
jgi:DNA-binding CsgD family transcriptional regulator